MAIIINIAGLLEWALPLKVYILSASFVRMFLFPFK